MVKTPLRERSSDAPVFASQILPLGSKQNLVSNEVRHADSAPAGTFSSADDYKL